MLARLEANTLTAEDRRVLGKVLTFYFWLLFALREAKLSLKRVKALVFGEKPKKREPPSLGGTPGAGGGGGRSADRSGSERPRTLRTGASRGETDLCLQEYRYRAKGVITRSTERGTINGQKVARSQ